MVEEVKKPIQIRFGEKYSQFFDEIVNCELANRKSDNGFTEQEKPMIKPRPGSTRTGNTLVPSWDIATAYTTGQIVAYSNIMYKALSGSTGSTPPSANWSVFTGGTSKTYFYVDRNRVSRQFRAFNNNLYYLNGSTWTSIKAIGTVDIEFSTQRVPMNASGADSTQYTVAAISSGAEKVKKAAGDTLNANNNIGTIVIITNGVYKGCYASIISYDSA